MRGELVPRERIAAHGNRQRGCAIGHGDGDGLRFERIAQRPEIAHLAGDFAGAGSIGRDHETDGFAGERWLDPRLVDVQRGDRTQLHLSHHAIPVALGGVGHAVGEHARVHIDDAVVDAQGQRVFAGRQRAEIELMRRAERVALANLLSIDPCGRLPVDALQMQQRVLPAPVGRDFHLLLIPCRPDITPRRLQGKRHLEIVVRLPLLEQIRIAPAQLRPLRSFGGNLAKALRGHLAGKLDRFGKSPLLRRGRNTRVPFVRGEFPCTGEIDGFRRGGREGQ